jgi:hypothetical protein
MAWACGERRLALLQGAPPVRSRPRPTGSRSGALRRPWCSDAPLAAESRHSQLPKRLTAANRGQLRSCCAAHVRDEVMRDQHELSDGFEAPAGSGAGGGRRRADIAERWNWQVSDLLQQLFNIASSAWPTRAMWRYERMFLDNEELLGIVAASESNCQIALLRPGDAEDRGAPAARERYRSCQAPKAPLSVWSPEGIGPCSPPDHVRWRCWPSAASSYRDRMAPHNLRWLGGWAAQVPGVRPRLP